MPRPVLFPSSRFALAGLALALFSPAGLAQEIGGCPLFPRNNVWNTPVDKLPVHSLSAQFIASEGADRTLHPDFSKTGGIPFILVPATQPLVPVTLTSAESDPGPYPIPDNLPIEGGGVNPQADNHGVMLQQGTCRLYEMFQVSKLAGVWKAESGAIFDLRSNGMRPDGWTSADAAGFAILPGLVRYDEIAAGEIRHAIRLTVPKTRNEYVWPARHFASRQDSPALPPMGTRFRLKAGYDISGFPKEVQVLLRALKKYGLLLADNGQSWYVTGTPDDRWNDEIWATLKQVKGSDLEAVDSSSIMISPNSAQAGTVATIASYDVPFSATPVFDLDAGLTQVLRLTGNVTASTVRNLADGQQVGFLICQDEAGGRTFVWPPNVLGGMKISPAPRACSAQQFLVSGSNLYPATPGASVAAPAVPAK